MYYTVTHQTSFEYSQPISESIMEVFMQPRTEGVQRCLRFKLQTYPRARIFEQRDHLGNAIHFFDIPAQHQRLVLAAESLVELVAPPPLPDALTDAAWDALDAETHHGEFWDMLTPSPRTETSTSLTDFVRELGIRRQYDPLTLLRSINTQVFDALDYVPNSTDVDSPIDDVLEARRGVCQDYSHVMIALVRGLGIPCRYVSGYLYNRKDDRSTPDASHAWVEAYLPSLGWIGFDPTNNVLAGERHIRVAVGRDYNDVPPTRGIFKGKAESELAVEVHVTATEAPFAVESLLPVSGWQPETDEHQSQQQ
jgi:transglutaminase-like putative cysteine protease